VATPLISVVFDQVGEGVATGNANLFREEHAARPTLEIICVPGDAHEEARRHAGREKAAHFGQVEELMTDVPNLELGHQAHLTSARCKHDEVHLGRRAIPVADGAPMVKLGTLRRGSSFPKGIS